MKFRIINDKDSDINNVIEFAKILFTDITISKIKRVSVLYSKETIDSGPLYGDFELDV